MSTSEYILLNRVFTRGVLKELIGGHAETTYAAAVRRYLDDPQYKNNQALVCDIYMELGGSHRNEYFYKNTLLNKLLLGVHSPITTTALEEVSVGKSKADFILINGRAVVYEIKTELDNLGRLESQLGDYYRAFNSVCVVTCESNYQTITKRLSNTPVGICLLTRHNSLSVKKVPIQDDSHLNLGAIFKVLRKPEYEAILRTQYGCLPNVSQFDSYSACKELFCQIDTKIAYRLFLAALKNRNHVDASLYSSVPYELKFLVYFSHFERKDYSELERFLDSKFGG